MKVTLFTLCNYASNNNGQLTIVDTLNGLSAIKFPWRAYFAIAVNIIFEGDIQGDKDFEMEIVKFGDNKKLFSAVQKVNFKNDIKNLAVAANIKGLVFNSAGTYVFRIYIDNEIIEQYPFEVSQTDK